MTSRTSLNDFFSDRGDPTVSQKELYSKRVDNAVTRITDAIKKDFVDTDGDVYKEYETFIENSSNLARHKKKKTTESRSQLFELIADYLEGRILYKGSNDYFLNVKTDPISVLRSIEYIIAFFLPDNHLDLMKLKFFAQEGCLLSITEKIVAYCMGKPLEERFHSDPIDSLVIIHDLYTEKIVKDDYRELNSKEDRPYLDMWKLPIEWQLKIAEDVYEQGAG